MNQNLSKFMGKMTLGSTLLFFALVSPLMAQTDMLTFMNCNLPYDQYITTHAEMRDSAGSPWEDVIDVYQPFRSKVNEQWHQVYWRKDSPYDNYYGEIFTFDANTIFLHAETFPPKTAVDPASQDEWDPRYDRFRAFVKYGQSDWGYGRAIAPVSGSTSWSYSGYMNTYICNSFSEYENKTAALLQNHFYDNNVYVERYGPFNAVFDGEMSGWTASNTFKTFDEVIVINQCMNNNAGRERFFFARKGSTYYGIVRWDDSVMVNGQWVVKYRTVGLNTASEPTGFSFAGMYKRARHDAYIAHTPKVNTGDTAGDGYDDFLFVNGDTGYVGVGKGSEALDNTSNGAQFPNLWGTAFTSQQTWNKPLGVGDVNGDDYADFVIINGTGGIYAGLGSAALQSPASMAWTNPWGTQLTSQQTWNKPLGVGDVNRDGYADFVFVNGTGDIWVGRGSANGQNTPTMSWVNPWGTAFTSQQSWTKPIGIGDVNGDGFADYVILNGTGDIYVGTGSADGQSTGILSLGAPWGTNFTSQQTAYKPLGVFDVNGDEFADIVVVTFTGEVKVALCDGASLFNTAATLSNPWGSAFSSGQSWNKSIQTGFGWGWWF